MSNLIIILIIAICFVLDPFLIKFFFPISSLNILLKTNLASWFFFHYQKFAKYQWIYRRNISVGNLRSELPTETFPSVIQSVTTDGIFPLVVTDRNTDRKVAVGSYRLNYERKSFRIKKKTGRWHGGFGKSFFSDDITDGFKNDSPYSDVTVAPFTLLTDSPRDLKWQIRTVTCLCFHQNHRRNHRLMHRRNIRRWIRR